MVETARFEDVLRRFERIAVVLDALDMVLVLPELWLRAFVLLLSQVYGCDGSRLRRGIKVVVRPKSQNSLALDRTFTEAEAARADQLGSRAVYICQSHHPRPFLDHRCAHRLPEHYSCT